MYESFAAADSITQLMEVFCSWRKFSSTNRGLITLPSRQWWPAADSMPGSTTSCYDQYISLKSLLARMRWCMSTSCTNTSRGKPVCESNVHKHCDRWTISLVSWRLFSEKVGCWCENCAMNQIPYDRQLPIRISAPLVQLDGIFLGIAWGRAVDDSRGMIFLGRI